MLIREISERRQFAKGSMSPKIEACLNFIKNGGKKSVITEAFNWLIRNLDRRLPWNMKMNEGEKRRKEMGRRVIGRINPYNPMKTP